MAKYLIQCLVFSVVMAALLLWPAGTWNYPGAWALIGIFSVGGIAMVLWLHKHSPRLLRERMSSPVQRDQKPWDRIFLSLFMLIFMAWMPFMAWDAARTNFHAVPAWLQAVGGLGIAVYILGAWWTFRENSFAAPVVKLQQGQKVIDTGPYAIVRHPMYTSALFLLFGIPLLLGSWPGLAISVLLSLGIAWRAVGEERTLCAELAGYKDYVKRVRYRFVPFIW